MSANTLHEFAGELLALCEAAVATTVGGPISRAFVAQSAPALDCCPQLTVHVQGLALDATTPSSPPASGAQIARPGTVNIVQLVVTVVRCSATWEPPGYPSESAMNASAQESNQDLFAIWQAVKHAIRDGSLFEGRCFNVYLDAASPIADLGACAGWTIPVRATVQGYDPGV